MRLERVCTLLRETNRQIGEIVHACGFDSESHVSALFRRRFGCTMRDYRKTR
ncbi:MAG: HTH-type transcriptional activator RhaS [Verrucomicrobia bacterium ADurb.Bin070]|nr:MAG: HTH-type transcriptional activator RhaS [Verrucomicrobia bacterium ADurb.Bin070]